MNELSPGLSTFSNGTKRYKLLLQNDKGALDAQDSLCHVYVGPCARDSLCYAYCCAWRNSN